MPGARYVIVRQEDAWCVRLEGKDYGPYPTQNAALRAAIDAANMAAERGEETEVVIEGSDREVRTPWTFGLKASRRGR